MSVRLLNLGTIAPLDPATPMRDVLHRMVNEDRTQLPVCAHGVYQGMVDVNDVLAALLPTGAVPQESHTSTRGLEHLAFLGDAQELMCGHLREVFGRPALDFLNPDVPTVDIDCPLLEAVFRVFLHGHALPVLGQEGLLHGMLSRHTILLYLMRRVGDDQDAR